MVQYYFILHRHLLYRYYLCQESKFQLLLHEWKYCHPKVLLEIKRMHNNEHIKVQCKPIVGTDCGVFVEKQQNSISKQ